MASPPFARVRVEQPPGYRFGLRQPCLVARLAVNEEVLTPALLAEVGNALEAALPPAGASAARGDFVDAGACLVRWVAGIHAAADWPVFDEGRVLAQGKGQLAIAIPARDAGPQGTRDALAWCIAAVNAGAESPAALELRLARLPGLIDRMAALAALPSNTTRVLRAAFDDGMPITHLASNVHRLGQGRWGRWMHSSTTDVAGHIATTLAKQKFDSGIVMRMAGLPAPQHEMARNADDAVRIAAKLGYPVVVKPANREGGMGVAAGLLDDEEVRSAFAAARKLSRLVLVEKHFEGRDYRLTVFHDKMVWAIERVPAGVTGDGIHSVAELVALVNANPRRRGASNSPLKALVIDDEASKLVAQAGFSPDSVVPRDRFVRLRRASNVAVGGTPVAVTDDVHPDNAALAVRAAAVFKLDIAGIDLLIADISRSWLETGALICEVNSGPTLGQTTSLHLYAPLVRSLVSGNGRAAVAVVVGAPHPAALAREWAAALEAQGLVAGWAAEGEVVVDGSPIARPGVPLFAAGGMLASDPRVEAILLFANDDAFAREGLPFARVDLVVLAGASVGAGAGGEPDAGAPARLFRAATAACDGCVAMLPRVRADMPRGIDLPVVAIGPGATAERIASLLREAAAGHRAPRA